MTCSFAGFRRCRSPEEASLRSLRTSAIILTQLLPLLYVGGSRDLLFGFNQTDAGLATLLLLMVTVPLVNLAWLVMEIRHAVKSLRERKGWLVLLGPSLALLLLAEALAVDYGILTQVRM